MVFNRVANWCFFVPMYGSHYGEFILLCALLLLLAYFDVFDTKEQSFSFSSIFIVFRLWIGLLEFWILQLLGSCNILLSSVVIYFASLYTRLSFQLTIGEMGLHCLCRFMVPCICDALGFMLMHFYSLFSFIVHILLLMLFLIFCGCLQCFVVTLRSRFVLYILLFR
jgi:hypothetical protein